MKTLALAYRLAARRYSLTPLPGNSSNSEPVLFEVEGTVGSTACGDRAVFLDGSEHGWQLMGAMRDGRARISEKPASHYEKCPKCGYTELVYHWQSGPLCRPCSEDAHGLDSNGQAS